MSNKSRAALRDPRTTVSLPSMLRYMTSPAGASRLQPWGTRIMDKKRKRTVLLRHFCKLASKVRPREVEDIADKRERRRARRKTCVLPTLLDSPREQEEDYRDEPWPHCCRMEKHRARRGSRISGKWMRTVSRDLKESGGVIWAMPSRHRPPLAALC